jgi:ATP/ADP translocase/HEAT repeat protein
VARVNLDGLLDSALRVRPGEARAVGLMFLYLMGVVSTFIIGRTVRDTLFLHRVSLAKLPLMYVAVSFAVAVSAYFYSRVADKYRRDRLITVMLLVFTAVMALFWGLLRWEAAGNWAYPALYVLVEIIGAIAIIQFWTFANDIFSARQAKRLFGVIGAGGVLANIICGFAIGSVAPKLGPSNLLLFSAAIFGACVFAVRAIARRAKNDLEAAVRRPRRRIGLTVDTGTVLNSKHLKVIAGIVVLTFLTVTLVDYQFKVLARDAFQDERELAAYFGYFYGFSGIIASVMQFFVTGRLLERSGIVVSLLVLPVALVFGAGAMLAVPMLLSGIVAATIAKAAENTFRYTINDATMQVLYVPVASHQRGRAKAFIDGILKPASIGLSGVVIYMGARILGPEQLALDLAYVDLVLLVGWIALVVGIRSEYVKSLIETLHARRLDLSGPWSPVVDDHTLKALKQRLIADEEANVLHALELLPSVDADFSPELRTLLQHRSTTVRIGALRLIGASGKLEGAQAIPPLMSDPVPEVRAAAIGAFCAVGRERAIRFASPFLADKSPMVRASSVAALIKHGGLDGILTAAEALKGLLTSKLPEERLQGARVLSEIKVRNFFQPVLELLQDAEPKVRLAAIEAAGEMQSKELVPALIYKLGDHQTAQAASRALVRYGRDVERVLFKVLDNRQEDLAIRRRVPRILGFVGEQEAINRLMINLESAEDPELRMAIARAAARIRERHPRVKVDESVLDHAQRTTIQGAYQALATIADLGLPADDLLPEALLVRHKSRLALAFRLLQIRYPSRTIQLVYSNLGAENKAVRANALELVDNLISKEESRLLMPLLEDHSREEKLKQGMELFTLERHPPEVWLGRLLDDPHPWIVSCTLHLVRERGMVELVEQAAQHLRSADAVCRETACFTLAALVRQGPAPHPEKDAEAIRRLAKGVAEDKVSEVRRASAALLEALALFPEFGGPAGALNS